MSAAGQTPAPPLPDPIPLQRRLLTADRVSAELERARQGIWMQRSRADFEALVQRAARAVERRRDPPRLLETRYSAQFVDNALVGTGVWHVANASGGAGVVELKSLNLALSSVKLHHAVGVADAILGDLDGKDLGVYVERPGEQSVVFDWSARGDVRPDGTVFNLRTPACAVATLEVILPAGQRLFAARDACLVTGPLPTKRADEHRWLMAFSGRPQLDLRIGRIDAPGTRIPLFAKPTSRLDLAPDRLRAEFAFAFEAFRHGVRELRIALDPSLHPYEVQNNNLEAWEWAPAPQSLLRIRLREPSTRGVLRVRCLAPLPRDRSWTIPAARLEDAVAGDELVTLRVQAGLQLDNFQLGSFRFRDAKEEPGDDKGGQMVALAGPAGATAAARPSATLRFPSVAYRIREHSWWHIDTAVSTLTAHLTCSVSAGRLFRLPLQVPPGWLVEEVTSSASSPRPPWSVSPSEHGAAHLVVELPQAATSDEPVRLVVKLRHAVVRAPKANGALSDRSDERDFPDLKPIGASQRDGLFCIGVDSKVQADVETTLTRATPSVLERQDFGGGAAIDHCFQLHDEAVAGRVRVHVRPTVIRARSTGEVVLGGERAAAIWRFELAPAIGNPETLDFFLTAPTAGPVRWKVIRGENAVRKSEHLPSRDLATPVSALACDSALAALHWAALVPHGVWWRLTLAHPLHEPLTVQAAWESRPGVPLEAPMSTAERPSSFRRWELPLAVVAAAEEHEGDLRLHSSGGDQPRVVHAQGIQEIDSGAPESTAWQRYRTGNPPLTLVVEGPANGLTPSADAVADRVVLITRVDAQGALRRRFQFRVWNWRQPLLPVSLPPGVRARAAAIDGHTLDWLAPDLGRAGAVALPIAAGRAWHDVALEYEDEETPTGWPVWNVALRLHSPPPDLPVRTLDFRSLWHLPPGVVPRNRGYWTLLSRGIDDAGVMEEADRGWWEAVAGVAPDELIVVRQSVLPVVGLTLATLFLFGAWRQRTVLAQRGFWALACWLGLWGLAAIGLPSSYSPVAWWPLGAGLLVAVTWLSARLRRRHTINAPVGSTPPAPRSRAGAKQATALSAVVVAFLSASRADAPEPTTVYLLSGGPTNVEQENVLAPPLLFDRLEALTRDDPLGMSGAVVLSAAYDGSTRTMAAETAAAFKADLLIHAFADRATLHLPFGGVELEEAWLDGARAYPTAELPPRSGYHLPLTKRGGHRVRLHFLVRLQGNDQERELRFSMPEIAQSRLVFEMPAGTAPLHAPLGRGVQRWRPGGISGRLEADLGRVAGPLTLRWRSDRPRPRADAVRVREVHLWDLRTDVSALTTVFQYRVEPGAVDSFAFDVPDGLEIRNLEAEPAAGNAAPPRLKDWQLRETDGRRQVDVEFQTPVSGDVRLLAQFVPRFALPAVFLLPVPRPHDRSVDNGLIAYRVEDVEASVASHQGVARFSADEFARLWSELRSEDFGPPTNTFSFKRPTQPAITLRLKPPADRLHCAQQLTWQVGWERGELRVAAHCRALDQPFLFLEWEIPKALAVGEVQAPHLLYWTRTASKLQLWFKTPVADAQILVDGSLTVPAGAPGAKRVDLPSVHCRSATEQFTELRIVADPAVAVAPTRVKDMVAAAVLETGGAIGRGSGLPALLIGLDWLRLGHSLAEQRFVANRSTYSCTVQLRRKAADSRPARLLTFAEFMEGDVVLSAMLTSSAMPGTSAVWTLRLRYGDGGRVTIEPEAGGTAHELPTTAEGRSWLLRSPGNGPGLSRWTLSFRTPVASLQPLLPEFIVEGDGPVERWLALARPHPPLDGLPGVRDEKDPGAVLGHWPKVAERIRRAGGQVWRIEAGAPPLRWQPRGDARQGGPAPPQVLLIEQAAAVPDGRRWRHAATYWLHCAEATAVTVTLPAAARLETAAVDGRPLPDVTRPQVAAPLEAGLSRVRLTWAFDDERLELPVLDLPRLAPAAGGEVAGRVYIPAGFRADVAFRGTQERSAGQWEVERCAAFLRLIAYLAQRDRPAGDTALADLREAQAEFVRAARRAQERLDESPDAALGPDGQRLDTRLQALRDQNRRLARAHGFDRLRTQAEKQPLAVPESSDADPRNDDDGSEHQRAPGRMGELRAERGRPLFWRGAALAASLRVRLIPEAANAPARLRDSASLLGLFLLLSATLAVSRLVSYRSCQWVTILLVASWGIRQWGVGPASWMGLTARPAWMPLSQHLLDTAAILVGVAALAWLAAAIADRVRGGLYEGQTTTR